MKKLIISFVFFMFAQTVHSIDARKLPIREPGSFELTIKGENPYFKALSQARSKLRRKQDGLAYIQQFRGFAEMDLEENLEFSGLGCPTANRNWEQTELRAHLFQHIIGGISETDYNQYLKEILQVYRASVMEDAIKMLPPGEEFLEVIKFKYKVDDDGLADMCLAMKSSEIMQYVFDIEKMKELYVKFSNFVKIVQNPQADKLLDLMLQEYLESKAKKA